MPDAPLPPLPFVGQGVHVVQPNARVDRHRRRITGRLTLGALELVVIEGQQPPHRAAAGGTYVQVHGLGWCPLHHGPSGWYVRAAEATPTAPALTLFHEAR